MTFYNYRKISLISVENPKIKQIYLYVNFTHVTSESIRLFAVLCPGKHSRVSDPLAAFSHFFPAPFCEKKASLKLIVMLNKGLSRFRCEFRV